MASVQPYPRISEEKDKFHGYLDTDQLKPHKKKIDPKKLQDIIQRAIKYAEEKSSREILSIPLDVEEIELKRSYSKEGKKLFSYFLKYCGDPASSSYECLRRHYSYIAKEAFRNRTLQKQRMNSGWRYQYIAKEAAISSQRFDSISDLNSQEADFNAMISFKKEAGKLNMYISIKNRSNTMGGQDWPKAIRSLEDVARLDKNREGTYVCIFGIAMEEGSRVIRKEKKTGNPYSPNTEIWFSDFFWPFFSNYSYKEITRAVLDVLLVEKPRSLDPEINIPNELLESFGVCCQEHSLIDGEGYFNDPYKLMELFCSKKK